MSDNQQHAPFCRRENRPNTPDCGGYDAERDVVYAVRCDGEDYYLIGETAAEVQGHDGDDGSFGQCQSCGSFDSDGNPVGYAIEGMSVRCDGCGARYSIVLRPAKEVVFV